MTSDTWQALTFALIHVELGVWILLLWSVVTISNFYMHTYKKYEQIINNINRLLYWFVWFWHVKMKKTELDADAADAF